MLTSGNEQKRDRGGMTPFPFHSEILKFQSLNLEITIDYE